MKIGLLHFRVGFTDGVSLEMNKWKKVLEELEHEVFFVAGESSYKDTYIIEEMSISSSKHKMYFNNCYNEIKDFKTPNDLEKEIVKDALVIEKKLKQFIDKYKIDLLIPNNVSSLGLNLPTGLAVANLIKNTNIKVLYHHHDFYWERERYNNPQAPFIKEYLLKYFPYNNDRTKHVVINEIAQSELKERRNINSTVIPNVFDFKQKPWIIDEFNNDLRSRLNIKKNDLVFLQATRIEDRKAIELALDIVREVYNNKEKIINKKLYNDELFTENSKIHFVMAGLNEITEEKYQILKNKIDNMPYEIHIISDIIKSTRNNTPKYYSLWDVYTMADIVTYPSILEGWGNQLIEGIFALKPIIIYEYPVFLTDIKNLEFDLISLGNKHLVNEKGLAVIKKEILIEKSLEIIGLLTDKKRYQNITINNKKIGESKLSYDSLKNMLKTVI
ncbi:MAG: glycosyltransferase family 4 protein [Acholeplasmataceae bacterium]